MDQMNREDFSDFIKSMRTTAGLDIETLASRLNVETSKIMKYEECKSIPDDPYAFEYDLREVIKQEIQSKKLEQFGG